MTRTCTHWKRSPLTAWKCSLTSTIKPSCWLNGSQTSMQKSGCYFVISKSVTSGYEWFSSVQWNASFEYYLLFFSYLRRYSSANSPSLLFSDFLWCVSHYCRTKFENWQKACPDWLDSLRRICDDIIQTKGLTLWRPLLPYGYNYKASCARPA